MPTPRPKRRSDTCSISSSSPTNDEIDVEKFYSISRRRPRRSHSNYGQALSFTPDHRSENRCSQCLHCNNREYYNSLPRSRYEECIDADIDDDSEGNIEYNEFYGTMPTRHVSKTSRGMRQSCRSMRSCRHNKKMSHKNAEVDENDFIGESASDIYSTAYFGSVNSRFELNFQ